MKNIRLTDPTITSKDLNTQLNLVNTISMDQVLTLASHILEGLNTPTSLGLYLCIKYKDLKSLVTHKEIHPNEYSSSQHDLFFRDRIAVKLLSKLDARINGLNPDQEAELTFAKCENSNFLFNESIRAIDCGRASILPAFDTLLARVRTRVSSILGEFDIEEWLDSCRFGPGLVAFGPKSTEITVKLGTDLAITQDLVPYAASFFEEFEGWWDSVSYASSSDVDINVVRGGKYTQVPKSAKTNRNIETQPLINGFLQLGLGQVIRRRLQNIGVDLYDQKKNQSLAKEGSLSGYYATVDLSNASDNVSYGIVKLLLPEKWFHALNLVRTKQIYKGSTWHPLHRFSSMGNGFTFELETLIFKSLCDVVCENPREVSVYGDDIIIPSHKYDKIVRALNQFGFTVNKEKSFSNGYFRESCGADFFNGIPVRPYYIKELPNNDSEIIQLANGVARVAHRLGGFYHFDAKLRRAVSFCHSLLSDIAHRRVAHGQPDDDSYVYSPLMRSGYRIEVHTKKRNHEHYYPVKAALLYKQYKKAVEYRIFASGQALHSPEFESVKRVKPGEFFYKCVEFSPFKWYHTWGHPLGMSMGWVKNPTSP